MGFHPPLPPKTKLLALVWLEARVSPQVTHPASVLTRGCLSRRQKGRQWKKRGENSKHNSQTSLHQSQHLDKQLSGNLPCVYSRHTSAGGQAELLSPSAFYIFPENNQALCLHFLLPGNNADKTQKTLVTPRLMAPSTSLTCCVVNLSSNNGPHKIMFK